jgi:hypothetical protein
MPKLNAEKKLGLLLPALLLVSLIAGAQPRKIENLPKFDIRKFHFGFTIGINSADFVLKRVPDFTPFDSLFIVEPASAPGFNLGLVADYHITPVLNLRFLPGLSFVQRSIDYSFRTNTNALRYRTINKPVESAFLEFPLHIKYRSMRLNNFAAYVLGGVNFRRDLASQEDVSPVFGQEMVKLHRQDFAYEVGVGFDFFMEYFKFSPEIKLSFGLPDLLVRDNTIWTNPIRRLTSRIFVVSFHFEG